MLELNATDLPRFMRCNGSRLLGGIMPPSNSDATARDEGTAAHWLINQSYRLHMPVSEFTGRKAPNGVIITNAIVNSVIEFSSYVNSCDGIQHGVEVDCGFENIESGYRINARTDHFNFTGYQTLEINDFKHGFRIVEPRDNWTMIAYAIGVSHKLVQAPHDVHFRVHQPRVPHPDGPVRSWRISYDELLNRYRYLSNRLANPDDELHSGAHCDKCPNQTICPAFRAALYNSIDVSDTAHAETISDAMIAAELSIVSDAEKRIKSRKKQLEDLAIYRMRQGAVIEGFSMVRSYGNSAWKDGFTPEFLSTVLGVNCSKTDAITPSQAIAAGAPEPVVKQLSERKESGLKLTRVNAEKLAARLFGKGK